MATAAKANGRPTDLFTYLSEKDHSKFKHRLPFETQVEMYRFAISHLDTRTIVPALCKEDVSVWKAVGLKFDGCHCLLGGSPVPGEIVSTKSYTAELLSLVLLFGEGYAAERRSDVAAGAPQRS